MAPGRLVEKRAAWRTTVSVIGQHSGLQHTVGDARTRGKVDLMVAPANGETMASMISTEPPETKTNRTKPSAA